MIVIASYHVEHALSWGTHGVMEAVVMRHHLQKKIIQNLNGQFLNIIELVQ
jgi:hypothetical protein